MIYFFRDKLINAWEIVDDAITSVSITRYHHIWNLLLSIPFLAFAIQGNMANDTNFWLFVCAAIGV